MISRDIDDVLPQEWRGRKFSLLKALFWARGQLMTRRALWIATGADTVDSIPPFIRGWLTNTHFNGGSDPSWQEFRIWLRDIKREPMDDGWPARYLLDCQGDHEKAALKFLDFVVEYIDQFGPSPRGQAGAMDEGFALGYGPLPREWGGRQVRLLDALIWARQQMHNGRELSFLTGANDIDSLLSFQFGWQESNRHNDRYDGWREFIDWLVEVKKACFSEWHVTFLRYCQGDHQKAALRLMDFAAEYVDLEHSSHL